MASAETRKLLVSRLGAALSEHHLTAVAAVETDRAASARLAQEAATSLSFPTNE